MLVPQPGNGGSVTVDLDGMGGDFAVKAIDIQTGQAVTIKTSKGALRS